MFIRGLLRIGNNRQVFQNGAEVTLPRDLVRSGCPLDSMPELGNRDRSNLKLIIGPGRHPVLEVESALFATNHNVRVQNYRHRSEEHTSELQSRGHLVCRLLLEKKKINNTN